MSESVLCHVTRVNQECFGKRERKKGRRLPTPLG